MVPSRFIRILVLVVVVAGCGADSTERPFLTGRALLPADTFAPGPPTGAALTGEFNGRTPPFAAVPVQGFSSLVPLDRGEVLVLQDNGFGKRGNSGDVPLRWYRLGLDLDTGDVELRQVITLGDPHGHVPFSLRRGGDPLTGGDFDPESFVQLDDGTFWIGEEFGPFLLHCAADGTLLMPPVPVVVPATLLVIARGRRELRSPDHPDLRSLNDDLARRQANLPRSGGLEGLALAPDGRHLYVAVEKALSDDPWPERRLILEFDTGRAAFTGRWWTWTVDGAGISIASLACTPGGTLVLTERDEFQGAEARLKRIYRARPDDRGQGGILDKFPVVDLLDLGDPHGWTVADEGSIGLGPDYAFPYVTPECLAVLDKGTLLVANDNNYPFSDGRRPGQPDPNEFIRIHLPQDLEP